MASEGVAAFLEQIGRNAKRARTPKRAFVVLREGTPLR